MRWCVPGERSAARLVTTRSSTLPRRLTMQTVVSVPAGTSMGPIDDWAMAWDASAPASDGAAAEWAERDEHPDKSAWLPRRSAPNVEAWAAGLHMGGAGVQSMGRRRPTCEKPSVSKNIGNWQHLVG